MKHLSILLAVVLLSSGARIWALTYENFGNDPLGDANYRNWPGIMPLVNHPCRVYHVWTNGNEFFHYQGNCTDVNDALRKLAASKFERREVLLRPGPGTTKSSHGKTIPFLW